MRKLAIYDLDKTLVRRATFTPFLVFAARNRAPVRLLLLPLWLLAMAGYKIGFCSRSALKTFGMRLMIGSVSADELEYLGQSFVKRLETGDFMTGPVEMLRSDLEEGTTVLLATAAFEFYSRRFAERLGIEHVVATIWENGEIWGSNCYGTEKLARVRCWLAEQGDDAFDHIKFVSDSFADAPMLDFADEPVFVSRSERKRLSAQSRGWEVMHPLVSQPQEFLQAL
ncbi:HAD-IB family hydrolase [Erythrobacter litoralis]|uniref:HAD family hydrolase n=1 Tax=Erythrobacter litoralis TaxID=39960 RepID=UPI0024347ED6|nr:HAD-IB family phosphatase [Erythrobacter litoralis]MDG6078272.1 HAD-IB family hydrolase [Erythrobacter litoralis]